MRNVEKITAVIEPALRAARVPGAAIAVVAGDEVVFTAGYGHRDLQTQAPMSVDTVYPIASTTKAITATLVGMLVDRGVLGWDVPVREYLPQFRLQHPFASTAVTLRDLVAMRTGLPRHDWVWMGNPITRRELVERVTHLPLSAEFRQRFQYNNVTSTLAGHIAEVVTGLGWEELVRKHIFEPLQMTRTGFAPPAAGNVIVGYHENERRTPVRNYHLHSEVIAPAGGVVHSTIRDMARWVAFNLNGGGSAGGQLISGSGLQELHSPCMPMGDDPVAPSPNAVYGLGWAIDTCNGRLRLTHGGDLHDVISCVSLYPEEGLGVVSVVNLAVSRLARAVNQCAFDLISGNGADNAITAAIETYEARIRSSAARCARARRIAGTAPSHPLDDYVGVYQHPGYGRLSIRRDVQALALQRVDLVLPLEHWHYDSWVVADNDLFQIHKPHGFDRASRIVFETDMDGAIAALHAQLELAVAPLRFAKVAAE